MVTILFLSILFQVTLAQYNTGAIGGFSGSNNPFQPNYGIQNTQYMNQPFGPPPVRNNPYANWGNNQAVERPYGSGFNSFHNNQYSSVRCPQHWVQFQKSCYRFIKSPIKNRHDARRNCQAYGSDLVSINNPEEHGFIVYQLLFTDYNKRKWYTSVLQQGPGFWINEGDGTKLENMEMAFLPAPDNTYGRDYLVYSYSPQILRWGFEMVSGNDQLLYICEAPLGLLDYWTVDDRSHEYGVEVSDPLTVPCGPYFVRQPVDVVFDLSRKSTFNDVYLKCVADGYPYPTVMWYKEEYEDDRLVSKPIDPLSDIKYTLSGGSLIISNPKQVEDRGSYHCRASNKFGTIRSETITLSFGFISEFNLKRAPEVGKQNWGKAMYCDPPQHFPDLTYYWNRDFFPNFVEEDKRVFVSYDGALYFSAVEHIDIGNYSCSVQTVVSSTGKNGPFFPLIVHSNSNYQQVEFPNNFPKAFPEAPIAGKDVRLECIAFGYPVPNYNWTRKGSSLPRNAMLTNYNRILTIPTASVEDQGEYVCRAFNDYASIENSVILSIQAEPNFTIPLVDKHADSKGDLTWTCEAFGVPDVNYSWLRNGEPLDMLSLPPDDRPRYFIQDNVLTIHNLNAERDEAMYQCVAKNVLKTRYSSAQLRVLAFKPTFRKKPLKVETYAAEKGNVTIKCNPEAAPRPKFVWKKDNNIIGSGGRRRIHENGDLTISPVSRDDEGVYACTASNEYGLDESRGRLVVLRGPRWVQELPGRIVTSVWQNLTLLCEASADDMYEIAYTWTHNDMLFRETDPRHYRRTVNEGYLHIVNITFMDAGDYECIVHSAVGQIFTRVKVVVEGPPSPPGGVQVVDIGKTSATLQWCNGASNGPPVEYFRVSARTNWNSTWSNITGLIRGRVYDLYSGRLETKLENLSPWSVYEFRVSAINVLGHGLPSAPSPQYTTPSDQPYKAPSNVGGGGGKIGDLTIKWTPLAQADQNAPGIYYKIFWRRKNSSTDFQSQDLKSFGNIGSFVVRIEGNFYFTEYEVKVQAINEMGKGPESPVKTIFSAEDMPQVAPQQVYSKSHNSTSLQVWWNAVNERRDNIRGTLIGYRLKYWRMDIPEESAVYYLSRKRDSTALIVGLQPDTYYYVKVMAFNSAGEGPESERYLERTYRKAPQKPPSSVHITGINPSTVKVVWRYVAPSTEEEPVIGYKVRVWEFDQDMSTANDTFVFVGAKLEAYIDYLTPGKTYNMRVLAYSNGGDGRMSSPALTFQMGDTTKSDQPTARVNSFLSLMAIFTSIIFWVKPISCET